MSTPSACWISTTSSGVSRCSVPPSRWERKRTPSSRMVRRAARLHTWKPPESVRMGPSHAMKRCRPPSSRDQGVTGPEEQVVGVGEDDLGPDLPEVRRGEALDRAQRADRHEGGRLHRAVRACAAGRAAPGRPPSKAQTTGSGPNFDFRPLPRRRAEAGRRPSSKSRPDPVGDQHGVAVAVEAVAGGDGVRVGVEHPLAARRRPTPGGAATSAAGGSSSGARPPRGTGGRARW